MAQCTCINLCVVHLYRQIYTVRTLRSGEHETYRVKQGDVKKILVVSCVFRLHLGKPFTHTHTHTHTQLAYIDNQTNKRNKTQEVFLLQSEQGVSFVNAYVGIKHDVIMMSSQRVVDVRGHQFIEISYHTPSNCDVCNKTLPWAIIRGAEGTYECKRKLLSALCEA